MNPRGAPRNVLIAVPSKDRLDSIADALSNVGFSCLSARDGLDAWDQFRRRRPLAILASNRITGLDGIGLLSRIREVSNVPFVMEVGGSDIDPAVEAIQFGASAVVQSGDSPQSLSERMRVMLEPMAAAPIDEIVDSAFPGKGAQLVRLRQKIIALAGLEVPVLFTGEPGSGRTYAARTLCAADGVDAESILIVAQHETTDVSSESLSNRVLILQNVESLPLPVQARWSDTLKRLDSAPSGRPRRVLATSDRELHRTDSCGLLPELAARLSNFSIDVPPIREYARDIRFVIDRFCRDAERRVGKRRVVLSHRATAVLQRQPWLGNARQLRDVVDQLVAFSRDGTITKSDVEALLVERAGTVGSMRHETERRRRTELIQHLEAAEGNLAEVARRIGMSRGAVIYRAQKYGLLPDRKPRRDSESSSAAPG